MEVLGERQLKLSRKKSRMGTITDSFHFLGIHYSLTQPENHISVKQANDDAIATTQPAQYLSKMGVAIVQHQQPVALRITPHARTLRKARENVRLMVAGKAHPAKIKRYFVQWARWWVKTANIWDFQSLVEQFIMACWQEAPAKIAADVLSTHITELYSSLDCCCSTRTA